MKREVTRTTEGLFIRLGTPAQPPRRRCKHTSWYVNTWEGVITETCTKCGKTRTP